MFLENWMSPWGEMFSLGKICCRATSASIYLSTRKQKYNCNKKLNTVTIIQGGNCGKNVRGKIAFIRVVDKVCYKNLEKKNKTPHRLIFGYTIYCSFFFSNYIQL